jgi:hypothetical protein
MDWYGIPAWVWLAAIWVDITIIKLRLYSARQRIKELESRLKKGV